MGQEVQGSGYTSRGRGPRTGGEGPLRYQPTVGFSRGLCGERECRGRRSKNRGGGPLRYQPTVGFSRGLWERECRVGRSPPCDRSKYYGRIVTANPSKE